MSHLTVADQIERRKEHEMRALKRQAVETLRQGAPKGRKVLYVWDRAGIDFRQWLDWKHGSGIYQDPGTGIVDHYITNLPASVAPGVVALLYKVGWDVEKVFDGFKNKLVESKAWASSANAKTVQARMLCLTHNLMTLMEQTIERLGGVRNEAEFNRRDKREAATNTPLPSARIAVQRLTQRTVKFVRWLKNHLDLQRDWDDAIARLGQVYSRL